jgi:iron complex outermembrane recepter protein
MSMCVRASTLACVWLTFSIGTAAVAAAQDAPAPPQPAPAAETTPLPPVVVETKQEKPKAKAKAKTKSTSSVASAAQSAPPPQAPTGGAGKGEATAYGPVKGIVATNSATATKTNTPLIETPQSVSVITADRMTQQGVTSISEAVGYTAGVRPSLYGVDTRFDWLSIRGFDTYVPGFYVDGMLARNNNTYAVWKVEPYGTERIEILKGPPSVLYGQSNVGGLVNVVSKRPLDAPLNETELRIGNHGRAEGLFDFSGPATQDGKVLYRLTGRVMDTDTQVDFTEQERVFIAPALTWRPTASTSLTLLGQYLKEDAVPPIGFLPPDGTLRPNAGRTIPRSFFSGEPGYDNFEQEQWAVGYLFEHRFDEVWQVRQNLRYREMTVDYRTVYGTGLVFNGGAPTTELTRSAFSSDEHVSAFTMDNQVQADFGAGGMKHTVLAGLDYQNNNFYQLGAISGVNSIDIYNPVYGNAAIPDNLGVYADVDTTLKQTGVYLQEQAKFGGGWVATLGGRYDWAEIDTANYNAPANSGVQQDEAFTWKAGLLYHAANGLAPYVSYSESFIPVAGMDVDTQQPFVPETGQQYEVGIKYEMPGIRSLFTLAAFDIKRQNYVTYDGGFNQRQTGEIHSQGIEFEATAELMRGLDLIGAYTWLPTFEITKSSDDNEIGQRQPIVAENTASLWLHYKLQDGPLAGVGFGGGVRYIGETFGDIANSAEMTVPSFTLFDAAIDYEVGDWRFALNMNNIADETTMTCWDTCYYGTGRTTLASIRRRW